MVTLHQDTVPFQLQVIGSQSIHSAQCSPHIPVHPHKLSLSIHQSTQHPHKLSLSGSLTASHQRLDNKLIGLHNITQEPGHAVKMLVTIMGHTTFLHVCMPMGMVLVIKIIP